MRALAKIREVVEREGAKEALRRAARAVDWEIRKLNPVFRRRLREDLQFDVIHGTDTAGTLQLAELGVSAEDCCRGNWYEPAQPWVIRTLLREIPEPLDQFVFVDLGSGKGRALLLASEHPFQRIIGVELAAPLHQIAVKNVLSYKGGAAAERTRLYCEDASLFEFPADPLVIVLFNSFKEEVLAQVLSNLRISLRDCPRNVYFGYINPLHRRQIEASGVFRVHRACWRYILYASVPVMAERRVSRTASVRR